ncbi:hypothetical protein HK096_008652, partial [Nowakowskiella sp. JEL0078]
MLSISSLAESLPSTNSCSASPLLPQASKNNILLNNIPVSPPQEVVDSNKNVHCLRMDIPSLESKLDNDKFVVYNGQIRLPPLDSILKSPYERNNRRISLQQTTIVPIYNHTTSAPADISQESCPITLEDQPNKFRFSPLDNFSNNLHNSFPTFEKNNTRNSTLNYNTADTLLNSKYLPSPPTYHVLDKEWCEEKRISHSEFHLFTQTLGNFPPNFINPTHSTLNHTNYASRQIDNATGYVCCHCIKNSENESTVINTKKVYNNVNSLRLHVKLHHEKGRTFACTVQDCD